jgi:hypothetical protein
VAIGIRIKLSPRGYLRLKAMKHLTFLSTLLIFGGVFYWATSSSLEDMTRTDCEIHQIEKACEQLR